MLRLNGLKSEWWIAWWFWGWSVVLPRRVMLRWGRYWRNVRAHKMASDFIAENLFAMKSHRRKIWRLAVASSISLFLIIICNRHDSITVPMQVGRTVASTCSNIHHSKQADQKIHTPPIERLDLDEATCRTTYPLLFSDIDLSVARGPFTLHPSNPDYKGLVQARILNNKVNSPLSSILHTPSTTTPTN